jgi:hypothetical protein
MLLLSHRGNRHGGPAITRPAMAEALVALVQDRWVEFDDYEQVWRGRYWRASVKGRVLRGRPITGAMHRNFTVVGWREAKNRIERIARVIAGQSLDLGDDREVQEAFESEIERGSSGKVMPFQRSTDGC